MCTGDHLERSFGMNKPSKKLGLDIMCVTCVCVCVCAHVRACVVFVLFVVCVLFIVLRLYACMCLA